MANEGERSTSSADKGKGKAEDVRDQNDKKPQNDEKAPAEGKKKDDEPEEGMSHDVLGVVLVASAQHTRLVETATHYHLEELSEEDQQLKNELEMLVERLKVR